MENRTASVEVLSSDQSARWEELYKALPANVRDINFSFDYNFLYERNGDGSIRLFHYTEDSHVYFYPFLIRRVLIDELPSIYQDIETVYGYTGPISSTNDSDFIQRATLAFKEYCRKENIVCEFIRFHPLLRNEGLVSVEADIKIFPLRDYVYVDLKKTEEEIWTGYSSQNRNKIRKAEKQGVKIEAVNDEESFASFVELYLQNMQLLRAAKMYFFSKEFFDALFELAVKEGVIFIARSEKEVLGAAVFLGGGPIAHYFLAAASSEGKKMAAGNLLLHHGIKWSQQNGMHKLHLGGGVTEDLDDPLLVFKNNFSVQTEKFYIGKRIHDQEAYDSLVNDWDSRFPEAALKYRNILQRYSWRKEDIA